MLSWRCVAILVALTLAIHSTSTRASDHFPGTDSVHRNVMQGKYATAIHQLRLQTLGADDETKLQRYQDLLYVCSLAFRWDCVDDTLEQLIPLQSHPGYELRKPYFALAFATRHLASDNSAVFERMKETGAPFTFANIVQHPDVIATAQRFLHSHHLERKDYISAGISRSSLFASILMIHPDLKAQQCRAIVEYLEALLEANDTANALAVARITRSYLGDVILPSSILAARLQLIDATLLTYLNLYEPAAEAMLRAATTMRVLELNEQQKDARAGGAILVASAAYVLAGKPQQAEAAIAQHPLLSKKDAIIERGSFDFSSELHYAVAEIFVSSAAGKKPDPRWKKLLELDQEWNAGDAERDSLESYRLYALALLAGASGDTDAPSLFIKAANKRIHALLHPLASVEAFPLPDFLDQIVIATGVTAAVSNPNPDYDFILKASELLNRNVRHRLVKANSLVQAQPDDSAKRDAHALLRMIDDKQIWEIEQLTKLIHGERFAVSTLTDYAELNRQVAVLQTTIKPRFSDFEHLKAQAIQNSLAEHESLILIFPTLLGHGKLCLTSNARRLAIAKNDPTLISTIQEVANVLSSPPERSYWSRKFPVDSSVKLYRHIFDGLEPCSVKNMHVVMVVPQELNTVNVAALLMRAPPKTWFGQYDLSQADWAISNIAVSYASSAQHHLLARLTEQKPSSGRFLGVGAPVMKPSVESATDFTNRLRRSYNLGTFTELPEAREELEAISALYKSRGSLIMTESEATEENFRARSLDQYEIIHFATHGLVANEVPGLAQSALLLSPKASEDALDDGLLTANEISKLSLSARLIILSACNTAQYSSDVAAMGISDLNMAFALSGASTVAATLWPVDSLAARDLMVSSFSHWHHEKSEGFAHALAKAMREYIARASETRRHPYFWAAFMLFGNGEITHQGSTIAPKLELQSMPEFASGGELLFAQPLEDDLVLSIISEWDGKVMTNILTRRSRSGSERWTVRSKSIGAGRVRVVGKTVYSAGYAINEIPTPVMRKLGADGTIEWTTTFNDFKGYQIADFSVSEKDIAIALSPQMAVGAAKTNVILLKVSLDGKTVNIAEVSAPNFAASAAGSIALLNSSNGVVVAINEQNRGSPHIGKISDIGNPIVCFGGSKSTVYRTKPDFTLLDQFTAPDLRITAIASHNSELWMGGDEVKDCETSSRTTLMRLEPNLTRIWTDNSNSATALTDLQVIDGNIIASIQVRRQVGIKRPRPKSNDFDMSDRRWGEELAEAVEGKVVRLTAVDSRLIDTQHLTAGLSVFLRGTVRHRNEDVPYGTLGGRPAILEAPQDDSN